MGAPSRYKETNEARLYNNKSFDRKKISRKSTQNVSCGIQIHILDEDIYMLQV